MTLGIITASETVHAPHHSNHSCRSSLEPDQIRQILTQQLQFGCGSPACTHEVCKSCPRFEFAEFDVADCLALADDLAANPQNLCPNVSPVIYDGRVYENLPLLCDFCDSLISARVSIPTRSLCFCSGTSSRSRCWTRGRSRTSPRSASGLRMRSWRRSSTRRWTCGAKWRGTRRSSRRSSRTRRARRMRARCTTCGGSGCSLRSGASSSGTTARRSSSAARAPGGASGGAGAGALAGAAGAARVRAALGRERADVPERALRE